MFSLISSATQTNPLSCHPHLHSQVHSLINHVPSPCHSHPTLCWSHLVTSHQPICQHCCPTPATNCHHHFSLNHSKRTPKKERKGNGGGRIFSGVFFCLHLFWPLNKRDEALDFSFTHDGSIDHGNGRKEPSFLKLSSPFCGEKEET